MRLAAGLVLLAGCGNDLLPPGTCDVPTSGAAATVELVRLPGGGPATFDDMRYSPDLGKVVAAPHGTGVISLIDPDSMMLENLAAPTGVESADASATTVYAVDRPSDRILAIDIATGATVATARMAGTPDYVRFSPTTNEVWVSMPATNRLEILDAGSLAAIGSVTLPAPPEGLTFEGGRAYANAWGDVVAVDAARRVVVGQWTTGCGYSHGFPQVDDTYHLAFGGCLKDGGVGVVTMQGDQRAGFEAGGDEAVLAYDPVRHHLYVRSDGTGTLHILAACSNGELGELESVVISAYGHAASADDRGHVWMADATTGGVLRITDPF